MDIVTRKEYLINILLEKINYLAAITGFKQKEGGKITAKTFVLALVIYLQELHEITLDTISEKCEKIEFDTIEVTKQALLQRMPSGAKLMHEVFKEVFAKTLANTKEP